MKSNRSAKASVFVFLLFFVFVGRSQQNWLPLHQDYKDHLYRPSISKGQLHSLHPVSEGEINLHYLIRDSSKQYYDLTQKVFKEHLLEVSEEDYYLTISPVFDLALGKQFNDTTGTRFFDNTRGYHMELDLGPKLSFSSMYFENQNRFLPYYADYVKARGERYPLPDSTYYADNGVVPGAARTKPFKGDAFDYGYAIGNVVFAPNKYWRVSLGNQQMFVGYGHRSLFISDVTVPNVYLRNDFHIHSRLQYSVVRARSLNLLRRPNRTTVEAFYEQKPYGFHYLRYQPTEKFSINLFEGIIWNVGDSVHSEALASNFYIPVIGLSSAQTQHKWRTVGGLEMALQIKNTLWYSQTAMTPSSTYVFAQQLGVRWSNPFQWTDAFIQLEFNSVPNHLYEAQNPRLSYSAYHLSLAHPMETGFNEYVLRYNQEYRRAYWSTQANVYELYQRKADALLPVYSTAQANNGTRVIIQTEAGLHINRKTNWRIFMRHLYRNNMSSSGNQVTSAIFFGMSTRLFNKYQDF